MKRIRKPNEKDPRQFCLFEMSSARQIVEASRTKPRKKPVEASKTSRLTLMPPPPVGPVKQPGNSLKTEIPDREELNRLWKANPEALHALNRMREKNPAVLTLVRRLGLVPLCLLLLFACAVPPGREIGVKADSGSENAPASAIQQAVSFLAILEGWHDPEKTGCTGWGHRTCYDGTRVTTPTEADSLAAADLRALSARFRGFQGDSLLLALLAYNVGVKAVKTSSLMDSLTFGRYTSFCYIHGRRSERQYQRRRAEWMLFKAP